VSEVHIGDSSPEPIRVTTGGDGPKVELVTRRGTLPTAEATASPEDENAAPAAAAAPEGGAGN